MPKQLPLNVDNRLCHIDPTTRKERARYSYQKITPAFGFQQFGKKTSLFTSFVNNKFKSSALHEKYLANNEQNF